MNNLSLRYCRFGAPAKVLELVTLPTPSIAPGHIRVRMQLAPVNASDLIPITGAYRHRISLPAIAGYEGVGIVVEAEGESRWLLGKRVLPLRSEGVWQHYVDCPAELAIVVPEAIEMPLAARAYINPVAASLMVAHFPPRGKTVLITAAGSDCALLLAQWARAAGAHQVAGIYRSPASAQVFETLGITAIHHRDTQAIQRWACVADIVYDAVGGTLADFMLDNMRSGSRFISYGLLSGKAFNMRRSNPDIHWFLIRDYLHHMSVAAWQAMFIELWPKLQRSYLNDSEAYPLQQWRAALAAYQSGAGGKKPLLVLSAGAM